MNRLVGVLAVTTVLPLSLGSCSSHDDKSSSSTSGSTLTVYAASSLTGAFTKIGQDFEKSHSGVSVKFDFGGSSDLVAQLQNGAPADVFASADTANMDKATSAKLTVGTPVDFATNTMEIAVPPTIPPTSRPSLTSASPASSWSTAHRRSRVARLPSSSRTSHTRP